MFVKVNGNNNKINKNLDFKTKFSSKKEALKQIDKLIFSLNRKGYLLAAYDTLINDSNSINVVINQNNLFKYANIKLGNLDQNVATKIGINEKIFTNKPLNYKEVTNSIEKIISYYENIGYPFTSVTLDSIKIEKNALNAVFKVQKNKLFIIDSIKIIGNANVNTKFLFPFLSLKEKMFYNEAILKSISQKVKQLSFLNEKKIQEVRLTNKINKLFLFLDTKNASQFDGLIGILPDVTSKKTIITGDVKLKLVNGLFKNGETFDLEWRRLQTETQDFKGQLIYPYLFGTPFGCDYNLKIYRKDSSFIDVLNNLGINYFFNGLNHFKIYYKLRQSNIIYTGGSNNSAFSPNYLDLVTESFGLGLFFENLDYRFNPHQGLSLIVNGQTGNKIIKKNSSLNEQIYTDMPLQSLQFQFDVNTSLYLKLITNHVLKISFQAASLFGNSTIFRNELFRIGGLKTLRGFDEESIYTSSYFIPTLEYRFLYAQNSNILLFIEGAWYENSSNKNYMNDRPLSFGAGINFDTKAGILGINYAIGKQLENNFDFRNGKIHIGLTALF